MLNEMACFVNIDGTVFIRYRRVFLLKITNEGIEDNFKSTVIKALMNISFTMISTAYF